MVSCRSWPGSASRTTSTCSMMRPAPSLMTLDARLALQPFVVGQFQPFLADVVDIRETHQVRGHLAGGVEASVFLADLDALQTKRTHLVGDRGVQAAPNPDEALLCFLGQAPLHGVRIGLQDARQLLDAFRLLQQAARVGADRVDGRAYRQRLAVAVENVAARRGNPGVAQEAVVAFVLQVRGVDDLQVHGARDQGDRTQQDDQQEAVKAAGRHHGGVAVAHGSTTRITDFSGDFMPRSLRALGSTVPASASTACSSCRRLHSVMNASRWFSSMPSSTAYWRLSWRV